MIGEFDKDGLLKAAGFTVGTIANAPAGTLVTPFATNTVVAAGTPFAAGVVNYAAEVAYPAVGLNCNGCHVNDSYKTDKGPLGAVVSKPLAGSPLAADLDPQNWLVVSPMSATCTACHDSAAAIDHVKSFGNGSFGDRSQSSSIRTQEVCADCHAVGTIKGVDIVHGQK